MDKSILHVENLKKYYGDRLALDIPHLSFDTGKIYAIVGPNGSGKTTLLKVLNLLEKPTEGKLYFDGHEISKDVLSIRRQMTLVMQDAVLFRFNVYKNIAYGLSVRAINKKIISKMVSSALNMVGLAGFENRKARQLSAGEAQRVALARALVLEPKVLLLDEPTSNVDKQNVQVFESLLKKINVEQGTTIIFTTHDLSQAYRLTNRVISLLDGKIIGCNPENIFVGKFEKKNQIAFLHITPSIRVKVSTFESDSTGIYIDPQNISISFEPILSDQNNSLEGHIFSAMLENNTVRLNINAGIELVAVIDKEDFQKISQNIFNQRVYANFNVSDVHVF